MKPNGYHQRGRELCERLSEIFPSKKNSAGNNGRKPGLHNRDAVMAQWVTELLAQSDPDMGELAEHLADELAADRQAAQRPWWPLLERHLSASVPAHLMALADDLVRLRQRLDAHASMNKTRSDHAETND